MPAARRTITPLTEKKLLALEERANDIRQDILEMLVAAGSGHSAGPLGMADIFTALYFHVLRHTPKRPNAPERDRLFLSNGHIVPVRYVTMAHAGYFPKSELKTLRKFGSRLQGHPEIRMLPGVENTSGPLGDGAAQSVGAAIAGELQQKPWRVYCSLSDGELAAGIVWESALLAAHRHVHNLTWIIDRNNIQIDGYTEDITGLEPLHDKFTAFGWSVLEIDGHNIREFVDACDRAAATWEQPTVILAHTIPGKGVPFMEFDPAWHGKPPKKGAELRDALKALRTLNGQITSESV